MAANESGDVQDDFEGILDDFVELGALDLHTGETKRAVAFDRIQK